MMLAPKSRMASHKTNKQTKINQPTEQPLTTDLPYNLVIPFVTILTQNENKVYYRQLHVSSYINHKNCHSEQIHQIKLLIKSGTSNNILLANNKEA